MIELDLIPDGGPGWLDASGPESHLVLSTRIRLARNVAGIPFGTRNSPDERQRLLDLVVEAAGPGTALDQAALFRMDRMEGPDRRVLHERHLISRELAALDEGSRVVSGAACLWRGGVGVMVNEEDHLRLQGLRSGFDLEAAYRATDRVDSELGQRLPFAFHPEFGYLTTCPTNVGTGLRASVLIHLPALVLTKEIGKVLQGLAQVGLTFRGLYGEGSEVVGNFFQLSNQTTLGKSERDLLDHLGTMVRQVVAYEEQARAVLLREARTVVEDKVWRAYGLLRHARTLSFDEAMNLLSGVRLGVGLGVIGGVGLYTLNKVLIYSQSAHLAAAEGVEVEEQDLSERRARFVRSALEQETERRDGGPDARPDANG